MNKYLYCYNPIKKDFILKRGEKYVGHDIHKITHRLFWVFEKNNNLDKILNEWRIYQQSKFEK